MRTHELYNATSGLKDLDEAQKVSMLKIIDMKTEDMIQKVLDKIDAQSNRVDAQFNEVYKQFNKVDAQFNKVDTQLNDIQTKFNGLAYKVDNKLDTQQKLMWGMLIGLALAMISFILNKVG